MIIIYVNKSTHLNCYLNIFIYFVMITFLQTSGGPTNGCFGCTNR